MKRLILIVMALSSAALAQNTTCFVNGQWITCNTQQAPDFRVTPSNPATPSNTQAPTTLQMLQQQQLQLQLLQQQLQLDADRQAFNHQASAGAEMAAREIEVEAKAERARQERVKKAKAMIWDGHCIQAADYLRGMGDIVLADDTVLICRRARMP